MNSSAIFFRFIRFSRFVIQLFLLLMFPLSLLANDALKPIRVANDPEIVSRLKSSEWLKVCDPIVDQLVVITVPYWGFDQKSHVGHLIVHQAVSKDLQEIFDILHKNRFPIKKIGKLAPPYNKNTSVQCKKESKSKEDPFKWDNITAAFNCRMIRGKNKLSNHSYGVAIDINPMMNPYVRGDKILPESGRKYIKRKRLRKGMIKKDMLIYKLFKDRGWDWGGDWIELKDYQHFEKPSVIENLKMAKKCEKK